MEITGRIIADAQVVTLKDERKVVNFTVAVNDYFKPKDSTEGKQVTAFYNCAYWISPKVAEQIKKGGIVEVNGRIYTTAYMGSDEKPKASLHCHVNSIKVHTTVKKENQKVANELTEPLDSLPF